MRNVRASIALGLILVTCVGTAFGDITLGGDRLLGTQRSDGGWAWPLTGASSATNTAGPIGMGLVAAYRATGESKYLQGAINAGNFISAVSPPHSTGNGIFMDALSDITGNSSYRNEVYNEYYLSLQNGTYVRNSVSYTTETFAALIRSIRSGSSANLATWDLALAAIGAKRVGADTTAWVDAIKAEVNELSTAGYYDVIGLAGAVWAFAELGVDFDPTAGSFAAAASTAELAVALAGKQISSGGFAWNSNYVIADDGNEAIQETAYAILALSAYDADAYASQISAARHYLLSAQLATGGWANYVGGGENNEVTGEALWALQVVPAPGAALLVLIGMPIIGWVRRRIG